MTLPRKAILPVVVVIALIAGAACTNPPSSDQVGETLGGAVALVLYVIVSNIACSLNEYCDHPICAIFPCAPVPSTAPVGSELAGVPPD